MRLERRLYFETLKREVMATDDINKAKEAAIQAIELYLTQQDALTHMVQAFGELGNL